MNFLKVKDTEKKDKEAVATIVEIGEKSGLSPREIASLIMEMPVEYEVNKEYK